jgi:hypothetical protein
MADGYVKVQPDSTGKIIDTTELTVGAQTVERQRINIAGLSAAALLDLLNTAPAGTEYAVPVRNIPSGTQTVTLAQGSATGSLAVVDDATTLTLSGAGVVSVQFVGGPFTGAPQVAFEGTANGTNWFAIFAVTAAAPSAAPASSITFAGGAGGLFHLPCFGMTMVRARMTVAAASGSLTCRIASLSGASAPFVTVAGTVTVSGTTTISGTVNQGTAAALASAWPVKLTDGTNSGTVKAASTAAVATDTALVVAIRDAIIANLRSGAKGTSAAADVTSTASGANHQILDVGLYDGSGNLIDPRTRTWTLGSGTDLVSAVQGAPSTLGNAWPVKLTDGAGVNTPSVKAASTAAAATDPSLVVGLSPNSPLPAGTNVIGALSANQSTNLGQVGGSAVVTSVAGAPGVGGDTADGATDAGKSVKVGGKVVLNSGALPTAMTVGQRAPAMVDEYGRLRVISNRPKLLGSYKFESGRLTVLAVGARRNRGILLAHQPGRLDGPGVRQEAVRDQRADGRHGLRLSSPRVTVERFTFTGTAIWRDHHSRQARLDRRRQRRYARCARPAPASPSRPARSSPTSSFPQC